MKRSIVTTLIVIFLIGTCLRFIELGRVPGSLNWDEVSWGYNAYSIATTGKDEYGSFMPLSFKAFGDFKQPVYVYLTSLPTLLFGLNAFATRFPSALLGSLSVFSVFFFARELFFQSKKRDILALLAGLLFAISPWSIQFSRVAFEANVGLFFTITGIAVVLAGLRKSSVLAICTGSAIMTLSCYTYHSQKIFTPLLFGVIIIYSYKYWLKRKVILLGLLIFFVFLNSLWLVDGRTTMRGRSVLFTANQTEILSDSIKQFDYDSSHHDLLGEALHNRRIVYVKTYIANYLSHFNPDYLFFTGDNPRHHPPFMGDLYFVSLPFILLGMIMLWKKERKVALLIYSWMLLAPVASSLAVDAPNASRSLVFLPTWDILAAFGIISVFEFKRGWLSPKIFGVLIILLYSLNFIFYVHNYFSHTDLETSYDWQYGYKEAVIAAKNYQSKANGSVYFADNFEQPYIFYLFYTKLNPEVYIESGGSDRRDSPCFSIQRAYFGKCLGRIRPGDLFISLVDEKNTHLVKLNEINYPNGEVAARLYLYN